jgi:hypothetical protein
MMKPILADRWRVMHRWWSVRIGALGVILMAGVPALSDQYFPNIAPALLHWFPNHGQQWVPIGGAVLAIAARVLSQDAIIQRIQAMFGKQPDGGGNGTQ